MKRFDVAVALFREQAGVFACPVCAGEMSVQGEQAPQLVCAQGHAFDFARQGYVNLLLSHQKHSQEPGYDIETLRARKAMLETGFFAPLATQLVEFMQYISDRQPRQDATLNVLDAGTGEGFVFAQVINEFVSATRHRVCAVGTDISRPAIQLACQLDAPVIWCVANLMKRLPFADGAFTVLMNILAPANPEEYRRVLTSGGYLIKVLPLEQHLVEIRQAIYERERKDSYSNATTMDELSQHFDLLAEQELCYQRQIGKELTANLLHMSPLFWKGKKEKIATVSQEGLPQVTVHFSVTLWKTRE
ncbi:MAG: putative RNA methyltransferase [Armatimonadota bacterium]